MINHNPYPLISILGGTFDPCHLGHLHILNCIQETFHPEINAVLPCKNPIHKTNTSSIEHRLAMLKIMLKDTPFSIDPTEIDSNKPNETIYTVSALRKKWPNHSILWLLGDDVFSTIMGWKDWQEILQHVHLIILERIQPNYNNDLLNYLKQHSQAEASVYQNPYGNIIQASWRHPEISATRIRSNRQKNHPTPQLTKGVAAYIQQQQLYK